MLSFCCSLAWPVPYRKDPDYWAMTKAFRGPMALTSMGKHRLLLFSIRAYHDGPLTMVLAVMMMMM